MAMRPSVFNNGSNNASTAAACMRAADRLAKLTRSAVSQHLGSPEQRQENTDMADINLGHA